VSKQGGITGSTHRLLGVLCREQGKGVRAGRRGGTRVSEKKGLQKARYSPKRRLTTRKLKQVYPLKWGKRKQRTKGRFSNEEKSKTIGGGHSTPTSKRKLDHDDRALGQRLDARKIQDPMNWRKIREGKLKRN